MGEESVYFQTTHVPLRCILPKPGDSPQDDLIAFLILRAFRYSNHNATQDLSIQSKLISIAHITNQITSCVVPSIGNDVGGKAARIQKEVEKAVQTAFTYYEENRFIRKNVDPRSYDGSIKYFMLPRGEQIFDLFFSQSILFTIFRDAFLWDKDIYDVRCSMNISFEDLLVEALKYQNQLYKQEEKLFQRIIHNGMLRSYIATFGTWSISESFLSGIEKSIMQYYKNTSSVPENIKNQLTEAKGSSAKLTSTFDHTTRENSWFD